MDSLSVQNSCGKLNYEFEKPKRVSEKRWPFFVLLASIGALPTPISLAGAYNHAYQANASADSSSFPIRNPKES